eukprot:TRINITY_DN565_c0_g1_i3.p1 TRINITY_DN565_c0_g1~~TRINITY_DN565_c0_g1_i3.p1  ORF type:complete len:247 (+),score=55.24 TRINITY_DN565_c0_g1_i3:373-1113(+)
MSNIGGAPTVNVFVTGQPGVGKTTLILNVVEKLPSHLIAGFYTVEARAEGSGERLGLDVVTLSGERAPLCRLRRGCGPKVGKYYAAIEDFERVVLPHLTPSEHIKMHVIDEIGRMELCSEKFAEAVNRLLASPTAVVFGSLPAPRHGHTLQLVEDIKVRPDTAVLTLNKSNRDSTGKQVEALLSRLLEDDTSSSGNGGAGSAVRDDGGTGSGDSVVRLQLNPSTSANEAAVLPALSEGPAGSFGFG